MAAYLQSACNSKGSKSLEFYAIACCKTIAVPAQPPDTSAPGSLAEKGLAAKAQPEKRRIIVTMALPYANGSIHLGHLLEWVQTDIWVRFQRMRGANVRYVCADDAHGSAISLRAEAEGIAPEELVARVLEEHRNDIRDFGIGCDNYYTTHSEENRILSESIYRALQEANVLGREEVGQLYDPQRQMFLSDRMVKGGCPDCGAAGQYGDVCEQCGATYDATELSEPQSMLSSAVPEVRTASNIVLLLERLETSVRGWLNEARISKSVIAKLEEWLQAGLKPWSISRPAPYFGFHVPDEPDTFFYVWLDAPIGYMASLQNLLQRQGEKLEDWWDKPVGSEVDSEIYHFIGKDIVYFHTLFWPAMLLASGRKPPSGVFVHGFLTINGNKMSKSRGTLITARRYLQELPPDPLRYYFATRLSSGFADIDLNLQEFTQKVNADLVGKFVNLASRTAGLLHRYAGGRLGEPDAASPLAQTLQASERIAEAYEQAEYNTVMREVMALADKANRYVQQCKPWELAKQPGGQDELVACCSAALAIFRALCVYLKPCVPNLIAECEQLLGGKELHWGDEQTAVQGLQLAPFKPLMQRLQQTQVDRLVSEEAD